MSANRVGPLVQALLSDPELREVFAGLSEPADADDLPSRLARHLEAGLTWPRPAGRGQQLLDNCRLIKILDPQRRRPSVFLQHLTGQAPGTYDPVYSEDFESHEPGRPPPGWEQEGSAFRGCCGWRFEGLPGLVGGRADLRAGGVPHAA